MVAKIAGTIAGLMGVMSMVVAGAARAETGVASSAEQVRPLGVGDVVPAVEVRTVGGEAVDLRSVVDRQRAVLVFYRGGWCPYCNTQLAGLRTAEGELAGLGYRLVAISPDKPEKLSESIAEQDLHYTLLSDSTAAAIKAFGLAFRVDDDTLARYRGFGIDLDEAAGAGHHLLPVPAVYVVGEGGKIEFAYWNPDYRQRLEPDKLVAAARAAVASR